MLWITIAITLVTMFSFIIVTGVEYSFQRANPLTLELKRDRKRKSNTSLGRLLDHPDIFWRTVTLVFYTILIILSVLIFNIVDMLSRSKALPLETIFYFHTYDYIVLLISAFVTLIIVFILKRGIARPIFHYKPENKVSFFSGLFMSLSKFFNPIAVGFKKISEFILIYLFNARVNKNAPIFLGVNPYNFYRQSIQGHNVLDKLNKEFFRGAVDLTQVKVRNCVTPRTEITAVDVKASVDDLKRKFVETKMSKIIIYDKHMDNILGYVHHLDMNTKPQSIMDILLPLPAVPGAMSALDVVKMFTKERKSIALVADEFGGTSGLVTMEDILEEIFGNIKDEYDSDELVEKRLAENEYIFSGRLKIDYLNNKYHFNIPKEDYETLSGFIIARHEAIPSQKRKIIIGRFEFEILLVTATKIESVKMKLLAH